MSKRKNSNYANMPTSTGVYKKKKQTGDYQKGRELNKSPPTELKAFDQALTNMVNTTVAGGGFFQTNINCPVNGSELYQRVGRKIYMKSLHIRGVFKPTGAAVEQVARLIVYYDSQGNTGVPTVASLLQDSNAAAGTSWASEINLTNRQRFKILSDKVFMLGGSNAIAGTVEIVPDPIENSYNVNLFIKLKGLETIYNGTNGGTVADITSGALGMMLVGDSTTDGNWEFANTTRLRYYD